MSATLLEFCDWSKPLEVEERGCGGKVTRHLINRDGLPQSEWTATFIHRVNEIRGRGNGWLLVFNGKYQDDYAAWFGRIEWPIVGRTRARCSTARNH